MYCQFIILADSGYRINLRRKIKASKLGKYESKDDDMVVYPNLLSGRFLVKSICIGGIGCPLPHYQFNRNTFRENK